MGCAARWISCVSITCHRVHEKWGHRGRGFEPDYCPGDSKALQIAGKTPSGDIARDEDEAKNSLQTKSPLRVPWIDPDDIAPVVVLLASDAARMISGATYDVTGGDSANNCA
jgi:NAD(P)-dependent dehydrogenase (short-subunit alcohol dehydrogenase family)